MLQKPEKVEETTNEHVTIQYELRGQMKSVIVVYLITLWQIKSLKGYCTPDQFCGCLCIFLKSYNTLLTSKIYFLT